MFRQIQSICVTGIICNTKGKSTTASSVAERGSLLPHVVFKDTNNSHKMEDSYIVFEDNQMPATEALRIFPLEFRRIYTVKASKLEYEMSELICRLRSVDGPAVQVETVPLILDGYQDMKVTLMPANITAVQEDADDYINWLKRLVYFSYPDITTRNLYCNNDLIPAFADQMHVLATPVCEEALVQRS